MQWTFICLCKEFVAGAGAINDLFQGVPIYYYIYNNIKMKYY